MVWMLCKSCHLPIISLKKLKILANLLATAWKIWFISIWMRTTLPQLNRTHLKVFALLYFVNCLIFNNLINWLGLINLNSLYLIGNKIQKIKKFAFAGLEKLNKLSLCNNRIEVIESNGFDGLTNLDLLNLKNNQLETIKPNSFGKLVNLRNLDLSFNQIESCEKFSFKGIRTCVLLNVSNNKMDYNPTEKQVFEDLAKEFNVFLIN